MRRRLLDSLPALAHYFHVRPWEVELLTPDEITAFARWLNKK